MKQITLHNLVTWSRMIGALLSLSLVVHCLGTNIIIIFHTIVDEYGVVLLAYSVVRYAFTLPTLVNLTRLDCILMFYVF